MHTRITTHASYRGNPTVVAPLFRKNSLKRFLLHAGIGRAPGIRHQHIVLRVASALLRHAESAQLGHVLHAPCDVILSRETIIRPDILFVRKNRSGIIGQKSLCGTPDLVIEVLPHINQANDIHTKKGVCSRFGIQEFWIVDSVKETMEILFWSELGYVSAGNYNKSDRVSSPLMSNINLPLSAIFSAVP